MQAALRFIGTNLRGFSLSRTMSLTLMHRRRPNLSGKLRFIVPQSDYHPLFILADYKCPDFYSCLGTVPQLVLSVMEVADISACIPLTIPTLHFSCGLVTAKGCIRLGNLYNQYRNPPQTQIAPVFPSKPVLNRLEVLVGIPPTRTVARLPEYSGLAIGLS